MNLFELELDCTTYRDDDSFWKDNSPSFVIKRNEGLIYLLTFDFMCHFTCRVTDRVIKDNLPPFYARYHYKHEGFNL